jgi:ABC-type bacteriocin/lantibiotic exporter with double-glycine peptidase domain
MTDRLKRRYLAPEIVQSSAMDCGPASLKCLLEGFGIPVDYGRLREVCQTDVDGTSINTMERVADELGLIVEQTLLPIDHLSIDVAGAMPSIVVVTMPSGIMHFLVLWRRHGRRLQVMDPGTGRRWPTVERFRHEIYQHEMPYPAASWKTWTCGEEFGDPLRQRMRAIGISSTTAQRHLDTARGIEDWQPTAALDAATRLVTSLQADGAIRAAVESARVLERLVERAYDAPDGAFVWVPPSYWSVRPIENDAKNLLLRGAVLVRVKGVHKDRSEAHNRTKSKSTIRKAVARELQTNEISPLVRLWKYIAADGYATLAMILVALALSAAGVIAEAIMFRGLVDLGPSLGVRTQRLGAAGMFLLLAFALLLLDWIAATGYLRMGRRLESRLRIALLHKLPRLGDQYFRSRLSSDLAERGHAIHELRHFTELGATAFRCGAELLFTTAGIVWLAPSSALAAVLCAAASIGVPLLAQPMLSERDLRVRTHLGGLGRFFVDSMLGLAPIRTHVAQRAVRREHESLLTEWSRACMRLQSAVVTVEGAQLLFGFALVAWLLWSHLTGVREIGGALLLAYWGLNLPFIGQRLGTVLRQAPTLRSILNRLMEPISSPESERGSDDSRSEQGPAETTPETGVKIEFRDVSVVAAGRSVLRNLNTTIESGEHIVIVGSTGAGKSSLVGVLLGWQEIAGGEVSVDGACLESSGIASLRMATAWVDPTIQIWNRSLLDNLRFGQDAGREFDFVDLLDASDLNRMVQTLPEGLQTPLGEGGTLVSGGEGQRVRVGRAMMRRDARLVVLDEPFRGLDRDTRKRLLQNARKRWPKSTLICITHDVGDTDTFSRVLVVDDGQIVEDDSPATLAKRADSCYRRLLDAEEAIEEALWESASWRRWRMQAGALCELGGAQNP